MPKYTSSVEPWERQKDESEKAYEAFSIYRDMGVGRTVIAVVEKLGKSRSLLDRWKSRWNWDDRVRRYDADIERQAKKEAQKGLRDMYTRQTKIAMEVQTKALQALRLLDITEMSPKDIKEYIRMATELERLNRTMSAGPQEEENTGPGSLADTIISAYEKRRGGGDK